VCALRTKYNKLSSKEGVTFLDKKQGLARLDHLKNWGLGKPHLLLTLIKACAEVSSYNLHLENPKGTDHLEELRAYKPSNIEGRTGQ
jgi:hypothetical protein